MITPEEAQHAAAAINELLVAHRGQEAADQALVLRDQLRAAVGTNPALLPNLQKAEQAVADLAAAGFRATPWRMPSGAEAAVGVIMVGLVCYLVCDPTFETPARTCIDERVGIITHKNNGSLCVRRKAISNQDNVSPSAVFDLLHMGEYIAAVKKHFGVSPDVPNTRRRRVYGEYFKELAPRVAHRVLTEALRKRFADRSPDNVRDVPHSMLQLYYETDERPRRRLFDPALLLKPLI